MSKNKSTIREQISEDLKRNWKPAAACLLYIILAVVFFGGACPVKLLTGFPCPGCGMTRALLYVVTFQFLKAWKLQPMIYFWLLFVVFWCMDRYVIHLSIKIVRRVLLVLIFVTIGWYIYNMFSVYPREAPYTYFENNLIHFLFEKFNLIVD